MWLHVVAVLVLCIYSFGDFIKLSRIRTKREDIPQSAENLDIELKNNCSCVYYYQCDLDGLIITTGIGLFTTRFGKKGTRRILCTGSEEKGMFVCCQYKPGEENKPPVTTERSVLKTNVAQPGNKTCGKQLPNLTSRIFADEDEQAPVNGEFPWMVAIFKDDVGTQHWTYHGGGSLIHPRVILTANHVVDSVEPSSLKVIANGEIELGKIGNNPLQERNVKEIIKHPQYNSELLYNDVALLILQAEYNISVTTSVNTLCLKPNLSFENKKCFLAGWGKTASDAPGTMKVLKKVELPTLSHSRCEEMLSEALEKRNFVFHESLLCAGGELGKDACKGDGGSPLICPTDTDDNSMYQVGIVAWGIGCGKEGVPGVYTNVQFLHNWIVEQLEKREINI